MWSDELDKKIKAAADNDHSGSYQDKNWKDMEALLDEHLPQKRKRRGIVIFFLAAGLAVAGYFLVSTLPSKSTAEKESELINNTAPENNSTSGANTNTELNSNSNTNNKLPESANSNTNTRETETVPGAANKTAPSTINNISSGDKSISPIEQPASSKQTTGKNDLSSSQQSAIARNSQSITKSSQPSNRVQAGTNKVNQPSKAAIPKSNEIVDKGITLDAGNTVAGKTAPVTLAPQNDNPVQQSPTKNQAEPNQSTEQVAANKTDMTTIDSTTVGNNQAAKKKVAKQSKASRLSITASFGPDLSGVGLGNPGEVRTQFGLGLAYAISDRFSVRTGLYAGRKVYTADSTQYHTPYTGGMYSFRLYEVNANCLVYEIPVSVVYNFPQLKNHSWFVSTGLSSYLMKEETYDYAYKNPSGQWLNHTYEFKNENQHFFSILNVSGGYQYHFNKKFSLLAEPYLKLPLSGIGQGSVKLNSAGVMFTASFRPFGK